MQRLFAAALELPDAEREEFLRRECTDDTRVLSELRALLEMDKNLANKTIRPIAPELSKMLSTSAPAESMVGLRVGAFELREELGRGGMGSVYRAERVDGSVTQQAAIKFVRRELLDANTLRRFQIERQTLAALDHPNIARLLDAGELDDGTPYFVMEYVAGVPITDYCARAKLSVRERVQLFRLVCAAVMQAHRNLVVHRDLKPGNILVDSDGVPKLLDFGIAKPLNSDPGSGVGEQTGTAHRYFSPLYAAPEQLLGESIGVGCDVYALGILLYELLAGARPFDFSGLSAGHVERLVTAVPPDAPSATAERANSTELSKQLRGDLDGIVLLCLRKAPSERYPSVEQLDADLGNYLDGLPVLARGGHHWYRAQKFARRNLVPLLAAALTLCAMLVGTMAFAWQARIAQQRASELEQVVKFQSEMLGQIDPNHAGQLLSQDVSATLDRALAKSGIADATRRARANAFFEGWQLVNTTDTARNLIDATVLKPAVEAIDKQFVDQPLVDAALRHTLANLYVHLGLLDTAMPLHQQALATRRKLLVGDDPDLLASVHDMGILLHLRADLTHAEPLLREAAQGRRSRLGEDAPEALESQQELAVLLVSLGRHADAEPYFRDTLTRRRRALGEEHPDTLKTMTTLATLYTDMGRPDEAAPYIHAVFDAAQRTLGDDDPLRLKAIHNMGHLLRTQGQLAEAEPHVREAVERRRHVLGQDHPDTLISVNLLSIILQEQEKFAEAESYTRDVLESRRRSLGDDHIYTLLSILNMGSLLRRQDKFDAAEPYFREALVKARPRPDMDPFLTCISIYKLGDLLQAQGRYADAIEVLAPAEGGMRKVFTDDNSSRLASYLVALGRTLLGLRQFAAAETRLVEAEKIYRQFPGPFARDHVDSTNALVDLYTAWQLKEPGKGQKIKRDQWKQKLDALAARPAKS